MQFENQNADGMQLRDQTQSKTERELHDEQSTQKITEITPQIIS